MSVRTSFSGGAATLRDASVHEHFLPHLPFQFVLLVLLSGLACASALPPPWLVGGSGHDWGL